MKKRGKLCTPFQKRWCRKILLLMKHLCIFLFVFNFGLNAAVHSQNQRVSIELKNASIEDLIVAIKSQCDMGFLYDYDKTKSVKNITVNMQNVLLSEVLSKALLGTGFVAEIENNMIIIKEAPLNQQKEARTVKGRVTDNKKAPLPGVTVLIKGTSIGVVTDTVGMYKVTLPDQKDITLLFSFCTTTAPFVNLIFLSKSTQSQTPLILIFCIYLHLLLFYSPQEIYDSCSSFSLLLERSISVLDLTIYVLFS